MSSNVSGNGTIDVQASSLGRGINNSSIKPRALSHGRKRPRTDNDPGFKDQLETPSVIQRRHRDFWFFDGNIILVAEGTGFKVYKGILASHSVVFRDMFALAKPDHSISVTEESAQGIPIVLLGDRATEVAHFLGPLFSGGNIRSMSLRDAVSIEVISAYLKLGDKYKVTHIRDEALLRLRTTYTGAWVYWGSRGLRESICPRLPPGRSIVAINLARTFNLDYLLPVAFYECAQLSPTVLIRGVTFSDGHVERLSEDDLELCLTGRQKLVEHYTWMLLRVFHATCGITTNRTPCPRDRCPFAPIQTISSDLLNEDTWRDNCADVKCYDCADTRSDLVHTLLKNAYNGLGKFFGVSGEPHILY